MKAAGKVMREIVDNIDLSGESHDDILDQLVKDAEASAMHRAMRFSPPDMEPLRGAVRYLDAAARVDEEEGYGGPARKREGWGISKR